MAFDKHNVVDTLNEEEASRFGVLRNKVQYYNNLGGALAVISRGPSKWKNMRERNREAITLFFEVVDFFIFTTTIGDNRPIEVSRWKAIWFASVETREMQPECWGCQRFSSTIERTTLKMY